MPSVIPSSTLEWWRDLALGLQRLVGVEDLGALDLLASDVVGLAGFSTTTRRSIWRTITSMLVVDLHTLQAVHVLHFITM